MNYISMNYPMWITTPSPWLVRGKNIILENMLDKVHGNNSDITIFLNFSKENIENSSFDKFGKYVNVALCTKDVEYNKLNRVWNRYGEMFDDVILVDKKDVSNIFNDISKCVERKYNINVSKFDCIIMNPPYDGIGNLYGKITLEAKLHSKDVVCLSPYLNYLDISQRKSCKEIAGKLLPYLNSYIIVDSNSFEAHFDKGLAIFHFSNNTITPADVNEIYWNKFKNKELAKSILNKVKSYKDNCYSHIIPKKKFDEYKFKVVFCGIRGNSKAGILMWDWTTLLDEVGMVNFTISSEDKRDLMGFPFNTENECKNFVKYINTDIVEFIVYSQKKSMNSDKCNFIAIPYLENYLREYSEKDLQYEFGLTDEELNYIHEEMKPFGWKTKGIFV